MPGLLKELLGVVALSPTDVWAVGYAGQIVHFNGSAWTAQPVTSWPTNRGFFGIAFVDASNGWAVGEGLGVAKTTNGGASWTTVIVPGSSTTPAYRAIARVNATTAVAVGDGGRLLKLTTTGIPAAQSSPSTRSLYGVTFVDALHGWAVGDTMTCLKTSNGGTTWSVVPVPSPAPDESPGYFSLRSVAFADANVGVAVGTLQMCWRTHDGGATWVAEQLPGGLQDYELRGAAFAGSPTAPVTVGRAFNLSLAINQKARAYLGAWAAIPPAAPLAPSDVVVADGGAPRPSVRVTWADNSLDEDGFVVQRAQGSPVGPFSTVATLGAGVTSCIDAGIDWDST